LIVSEEIQFDKAVELVDFLISTPVFRTKKLWETNTAKGKKVNAYAPFSSWPNSST